VGTAIPTQLYDSRAAGLVSLWSWLAVGLAAWTAFGLFLAIGMARALRFSNDLPPADRLNEPHARTVGSEIARAIEDEQEQYARTPASSLGAPHASSSAIGD
jgi:hypothetical protein